MSKASLAGALAVLIGAIVAASGLSVGAASPPGASLALAAKSSGGCPSSHAIGNFEASPLVGASWTVSGSTWTLYFSSFANLSPSNGVPGLIEYCVYPNSGLPTSMTASAVGANGNSFSALSGTHQGYFGFGRANGDPSNLPLDGMRNTSMGTASWSSGLPTNATILLHINDATECQYLYGGNSSTCFVLPSPAPASPCGGNPACKTALVAEAYPNHPRWVPALTQLHVEYTYTISNAFSNTFDMSINFPQTLGANFTGVRDFFNCTQIPDPVGTPGANGTFANYEGTGLTVWLHYLSERGVCSNLVVTAWASSATIVLHPGESVSWTIDTITGSAGFSGRGWHCLNEGIAFVWLQSNDNLLHHYHSPGVNVWTAS